MISHAVFLTCVLCQLGDPLGPTSAQLQAAVALAVALEMVLSGESLVAEWALERSRPAVEGQVVFEVV